MNLRWTKNVCNRVKEGGGCKMTEGEGERERQMNGKISDRGVGAKDQIKE